MFIEGHLLVCGRSNDPRKVRNWLWIQVLLRFVGERAADPSLRELDLQQTLDRCCEWVAAQHRKVGQETGRDPNNQAAGSVEDEQRIYLPLSEKLRLVGGPRGGQPYVLMSALCQGASLRPRVQRKQRSNSVAQG